MKGNILRPKLTAWTRELRSRSTGAEVLLWNLIRNRKLGGFKFRRQHAIGPYVLDFYCSEKKLAIELDGPHHTEAEQAKFDAQRTEALNAEGVRVIRFSNGALEADPGSVLAEIWAALHESK